MNTPKKDQNIDHDTRWKDIIEKLFEDFVAFFMPDLFVEIDFARKPEFLKQELHTILAVPEQEGTKITDSLVKLYLKNGKEQWILIHIEVQGTHETAFSERMFTYYYRIFDKFQIKQITSIAVFIGEAVPKNHNQFTNKYFGTEVSYKYNSYIVKKQEEAVLWKSKNPFAIAVLAALHIIKTKRNSDDRLKLKIKLTNFVRKHAEQGNFPESVVVALVQFVVNIMLLDVNRERLFYKKITEPYKNKDKMEMTIYDHRFMDSLTAAFYGKTFAEMEKESKEAKEATKKLVKEEKAKLLKKVSQKAKMKDIKNILNLHFELNLPAAKIASSLSLELDFVNEVLQNRINSL